MLTVEPQKSGPMRRPLAHYDRHRYINASHTTKTQHFAPINDVNDRVDLRHGLSKFGESCEVSSRQCAFSPVFYISHFGPISI